MARRGLLLVGAAVGLAAVAAAVEVPTVSTPASAQQATIPVDNPPIAEQCGLPVTLVLDASGSIQSFDAVEDVRNAAEVFLDAVKDTGSTARVVDFGTFSRRQPGRYSSRRTRWLLAGSTPKPSGSTTTRSLR